MAKTKQKFTAVYQKRGKWYIGWVEEIPGVNTQGRTLKELKENLAEAIILVIQTNRLINKQETDRSRTRREPIYVSV